LRLIQAYHIQTADVLLLYSSQRLFYYLSIILVDVKVYNNNFILLCKLASDFISVLRLVLSIKKQELWDSNPRPLVLQTSWCKPLHLYQQS